MSEHSNKHNQKPRTEHSGKREYDCFVVINPNGASIEVGSEEYGLAVPEDRDEQPVSIGFPCIRSSNDCDFPEPEHGSSDLVTQRRALTFGDEVIGELFGGKTPQPRGNPIMSM
jgi:hypothetical protein